MYLSAVIGNPRNLSSKGMDQITDRLKSIKLQGSVKLDLCTDNGLGCVNVLTCTDSSHGYFILVGLQRSMTGQIELVAHYTSLLDDPTCGHTDLKDTISEDKVCTELVTGSKRSRKQLSNGTIVRKSSRLEAKKKSLIASVPDQLLVRLRLEDIRRVREFPFGCLSDKDVSNVDKRANEFVESLRKADCLKKLTTLPQVCPPVPVLGAPLYQYCIH